MKINILKIDADKLNQEINTFKYYERRLPYYLIMNCSTEAKLKLSSVYSFSFLLEKGCGRVGVYRDIPIATCNALKDGEIEIV